MPQHDLVLDNGSGAAFRADANNALAALGSTMKGPNAPPAPIAGMMWLDDDTPSTSVWTLKIYDGADWISIATFDIAANTWAPSILLLRLAAGTAAAPAYSFSGDTDTGIYGPAAGQLAVATNGVQRALFDENGNLVIGGASALQRFNAINSGIGGGAPASSGSAADPNAVARFGAGAVVLDVGATLAGAIWLQARAAGNYATNFPLSLNPNGGGVNMFGAVTVDGKALQIQRGTEQATTSGTAIDFTSIPAGVRRITVMFDNVSFNGSDSASIQLGDSGGIETTGYVGNVGIVAGASAGLITSLSSAAGIIYPGTAAADNCSGVIQIVNQSGNKWLITGQTTRSGTAQIHQTVSTKTLSDVLDRIRFKVDGASSFDAGAINIFWEF